MSPLSRMADAVLARWYMHLLHTYRHLLPDEFERDEQLPKEGQAQQAYVRLIAAYLHLIRRIRARGPDFIERLQHLQLRRLVRMANKAPWWRARFAEAGIRPGSVSSVEDLRALAPATRPLLSSAPAAQRVTDPSKIPHGAYEGKTSGSTTGTPFVVLLERAAKTVHNTAYYLKGAEDFGFSFERHTNYDFVFPYNLYGQQILPGDALFHFMDRSVLYDLSQPEPTIQELFDRVPRTRPYLLFTHPVEIFKLLRSIKPGEPRLPIGVCAVVGHQLEPEVRVTFERRIGARLLSWYAMREFGLIAYSCPKEPEVFHIVGERMIFQIMDEAGETVPDGEVGGIYVTNLDNALMPLIKYETGDRGRLISQRCECGNPNKRLQLDTRSSDVLIMPDSSTRVARRAMKIFVQEPLLDVVYQFQLRQLSERDIEVAMVVRTDVDRQRLAQQVETQMRSASDLPEEVNVRSVFLERFPQTDAKHKPFLSLKVVRASTQHSPESP